MSKFVTAILVWIATMAFQPSVLAQGCAMCRTALESSAEGRVLAASFAHGILFLLFLPYAILGIIGYALYRAYRKKSEVKPNHA